MTDLGIVILNYNTREVLHDCLISLSHASDLEFETTVVDNCSADGSADMVRSEFPRVRLVASPHNGGHAYGNNLGLRVGWRPFAVRNAASTAGWFAGLSLYF